MSELKKLLFVLSVSFLFLFLLTGIAYAESTRTGLVTGDSVNLRSKPDTSAKVITQLSKNTKVSILSEEGDWYKIGCNDTTGWISNQYIKVSNVAIASGTISASSVNVRSKPDISSETLTRLDEGSKVEVYEHSGDWYRILIAEGRYAWVHKDYITLRNSTVSRGLTDEVAPPVKITTSDNNDSNLSDLRQQIVDYAKKYLGVRYKYGGTTADGFDCSGFVQYVFKHFDISLERTAADQGQHGTKVSRSELQKGDTIFFDTNGGLNAIEHAGIYVGEGKFIHASSGSSSHKVVVSDLTSGFYDKCYMCARAYIK
jgi:cell wall-associated NlpC family hydrolase